MNIDPKWKYIEQNLNGFEREIKELQKLLELQDTNAVLGKIRYIAEGVLLSLCIENNVPLGKKKPTLERMKGPLNQHGIIPKHIQPYVETIQHNANPGAHFQKEEEKLTITHTILSQIALVSLLEWYIHDVQGTQISSDTTQEKQEMVGKSASLKLLFGGIFLLLCVVYAFWGNQQRTFPDGKREGASVTLQDFRQNLSKRYYKMIQITQLLSSVSERELLEEKWQEYRQILEQYNVARNIYNTDILYFLGREMYLWEREIHFELLYAGTNLECLYRGGSKNRKKLLQNTEKHLGEAFGEHQKFTVLALELISGEHEYPLEVQRQKDPLDQALANPCKK